MDSLGLHTNSTMGTYRMVFTAAMQWECIEEALALYAKVLLTPELNSEQFELSKQLAISDLLALDDEPRRKVMLKLKECFYPEPLGYSSYGDQDCLQSLSANQAGAIIDENFQMSEAIFTVAGRYDFAKVCDRLEQLFGKQEKGAAKGLEIFGSKTLYNHIPHEGSQVHIGIMTPTACVGDKDYYDSRVATSILSGGMGSRLFTEVREKRGLCYSVGANHNSLKEHAGILCYAGTSPEKAQQTFDTIIDEFGRLRLGITACEMLWKLIGLRSAMILQR